MRKPRARFRRDRLNRRPSFSIKLVVEDQAPRLLLDAFEWCRDQATAT